MPWHIGVPRTIRSGPGTKSPLSRDRKATLCRVENNARGMRWEPPSETLDEAIQYIRDHMYARKLCGNCRQIAARIGGGT